MTLSLRTWAIGSAVTLALIVVGGAWGRSAYLKHQVVVNAARADASAHQAAVQEGAVNVYAEQIKAQREQIAAKDAAVKDRDARIARLQADVAAARELALHPPSTPGVPTPAYPDLRPVVEKLDGLNAELMAQHQEDTQRLVDRDALIASMDKAFKAQTLRADAYQAQAVQEHAARVAAEGLAKSERWKGRLEGGGTVATAAYLLARLL